MGERSQRLKPRTTPADVTKAEANEPSEFMLCGQLVFPVDQLGPGPLRKLLDEGSAVTAWWSPAFLFARAVEQMDPQPGGKFTPGISCLVITTRSDLPNLGTLRAFACDFKALQQAG